MHIDPLAFNAAVDAFIAADPETKKRLNVDLIANYHLDLLREEYRPARGKAVRIKPDSGLLNENMRIWSIAWKALALIEKEPTEETSLLAEKESWADALRAFFAAFVLLFQGKDARVSEASKRLIQQWSEMGGRASERLHEISGFQRAYVEAKKRGEKHIASVHMEQLKLALAALALEIESGELIPIEKCKALVAMASGLLSRREVTQLRKDLRALKAAAAGIEREFAYNALMEECRRLMNRALQ